MLQNNLSKLLQTAKKANTIFRKAGGVMLISSYETALQLADLYKDAGKQTFKLSKDVVKKTVKLTIENQKELIKTSGKAVIEVAQTFRQSDTKSKASPNGSTNKAKKQKKEVTIDDLLD